MRRSQIVLVVLVAVPFAALDVALYLAGKFRVESVITFVAVFAVMIGIYWYRRIRGGKVEKDERTMKLASRAGSYSWMVSFFSVCFLSGLDTLGLLRLTGTQYLTIVMMIMTFSYFIVSFVVGRRGDVE